MGTNAYFFTKDYGILEIFSNRFGLFNVLFDLSDYQIISSRIWRVLPDKCGNTFYAISGSRRTQVLMHRLVTNCDKSFVVDHINHNGLDNRKQNLNICTRLMNMQNQRKRKTNKSGYKNISYDKCRNKWVVKINHNKVVYKKRFTSINDAIIYRNKLFNIFNIFNKGDDDLSELITSQ